MERAWPLAGLYCSAVLGLTLTPAPRDLRFTPESAWPAIRLTTRDLSVEQRQLADIKLDINQASLAELRGLPDIGDGLAQRIVAARVETPVRCEADLLRIAGLSAGRLARLVPFLKPLPKRCSSPNQGLSYLP